MCRDPKVVSAEGHSTWSLQEVTPKLVNSFSVGVSALAKARPWTGDSAFVLSWGGSSTALRNPHCTPSRREINRTQRGGQDRCLLQEKPGVNGQQNRGQGRGPGQRAVTREPERGLRAGTHADREPQGAAGSRREPQGAAGSGREPQGAAGGRREPAGGRRPPRC